MNQVILLCGKIASGKTTFAKQYVQRQPNTVILSVDECMLELQDQCPGRSAHKRMEQGILHYFYHLSEQLTKQGCTVIIDHGFWLKQERKEALQYFKSCRCNVIFYYFPISQHEQETRIEMRNHLHTNEKQYHITLDVLHRLNPYFEEISEEEQCIVYIKQ